MDTNKSMPEKKATTLHTCAFAYLAFVMLFMLGTLVYILPKLYYGVPPAINFQLESKDAKILSLNGSSRYRVELTDLDQPIYVSLKLDKNGNVPKYLVIKAGVDRVGDSKTTNSKDLRIILKSGNNSDIAAKKYVLAGRAIIPLEKFIHNKFNIKFEDILGAGGSNKKLILDELSFYSHLSWLDSFYKNLAWFDSKVIQIIVIILVAVMLLLSIYAFTLLKGKEMLFFGSLFIFLFALCAKIFPFCKYVIDAGEDLRVLFASYALQMGPNVGGVNYGIYMAVNVIKHMHPMLVDGVIPWCRMPGYGFYLALAGLVSNPSDLVNFSITCVFLQIFTSAIALGVFFWAACSIFTRIAALMMSILIAVISSGLPVSHCLQIEFIMPSIVLLFLVGIILLLNKYSLDQHESLSLNRIPLINIVFINCALALWFFLRSDVVILWFAVTCILWYCDKSSWLKIFSVPVLLFLLVGLSWAFFKLKFNPHEFSMTTNSSGASFMVGLWQVPEKARLFDFLPTDGEYYRWLNKHSFGAISPESKQASDIAIKEVLRFYLTYPGYVISVVWHKFAVYCRVPVIIMLTTISLSLVIGYKRIRTFLLGSMLFFNLPVFFLVYSSKRFYTSGTISMIVASIPLLIDGNFYKKLFIHWRKTVCFLLPFVCILAFSGRIDNFLLSCTSFRLYHPFINPKGFLATNFISSFNAVIPKE